MSKHILVVGAGPAGGAAALGLKRLGYTVTVVGTPRPFAALEGVSERVLQGLHNAGFRQALRAVVTSSPREASWNGESNSANTEYLLDRTVLDQGIWQDLLAADIRVIQGRVTVLLPSDGGWLATVDEGEQIQADFLVEARGRAAPSSHLERTKGPATVSLLQHWQGPESERASAAASCENGWVWMARTESGRRYLQLTIDVEHEQLPPKAQLSEFCAERFQNLPQAQPFIEGATPVAAPYARISTPILCNQAMGDNWIRVGDAAMAVDPLSGNGIFQALSSALQAPAVVNTLMRKPENRALAQRFYQQRVDGLFYRFARIGRDFYAMEQRWPAQPFWQMRSQWPDDAPLHQTEDFDSLALAVMPVLDQGMIEAREVVVSQDQPLGIWHLGGIELAPLVRAVREHRSEQRQVEQSLAELLADHLPDAEQRQLAQRWLQGIGVSA